MAVKIRLQRHGKKGKPFYHVVAADTRYSRDGRFIEKLGTYDPTTVPATIELNLEASVRWLQNGAQATDTARAILSYKGALYKNHLLNGLRKGALNEEDVESKFQLWINSKSEKISGHASSVVKKREEERLKKIAAEKEIKDKRLKDAEAALAAQEQPAEIPAEETNTDSEEEAPAAE
ncbi:MAG: 30S ribosomal protein S16 [Candidatus Competibacteraceae bacterium]|nr:30S ribosomal protein S16 [Candidatus Competibacteraceae bacterium]